VPAGAKDVVKYSNGGWSATNADGTIEVGNAEPDDAPEPGWSQGMGRPGDTTLNVKNALRGTAHIMLPLSKTAYFTPNGVRTGLVDIVTSTAVTVADPIGYRQVAKIAGFDVDAALSITVKVKGNNDDKSTLVAAGLGLLVAIATGKPPAAEGGGAIVSTGAASTIRQVSFTRGLAYAMKNHLTGSGPNSLRTLDSGGSLSKWIAHVVKLATTGAGAPRAIPGGQVLELTAPMTLEAGGTTPVGVRLFQATGEETWRLTTILTHP
jgi:hypothetical protein